MKNLYKYMAMAMMCGATLAACSDDDGDSIVPSIDGEAMNIRACNDPTHNHAGEIVLKWDLPENPDYMYMRVEWYDPREKKDCIKLVSSFADSILIENTRARYGAVYNFKFTPVSTTETKGESYEANGFSSNPAPKKESEIETPLNLNVANFWRLDDNGSKKIDMICDGITNQTENLYHTAITSEAHYIKIDFGQEVSRFRLKCYNSNKHNGYASGNPKTVNIFRVDALDDSAIDVSNPTASNPNWLCSQEFDEGQSKLNTLTYPALNEEVLETPVRYICFHATSGNTYWNMAEIEVCTVDYYLSDPENDEIAIYDK